MLVLTSIPEGVDVFYNSFNVFSLALLFAAYAPCTYTMHHIAKKRVTVAKKQRSQLPKSRIARRSACVDPHDCKNCPITTVDHADLDVFNKALGTCRGHAIAISRILPTLIKRGDAILLDAALKQHGNLDLYFSEPDYTVIGHVEIPYKSANDEGIYRAPVYKRVTKLHTLKESAQSAYDQTQNQSFKEILALLETYTPAKKN